MLRPLLVFIHVSSAMGVFAALAMECVSLLLLRGGEAQRRAALRTFRLMQRVAIPSLLTTVASGIYLTVTVWGWQAAWIQVGFSSLIVVAIIGAAATAPRIARLSRELTGDDRVLWMSFIIRTFILIGIVFLMTVKPPLEASLIAIGIAGAAGLLSSLPFVKTRREVASA